MRISFLDYNFFLKDTLGFKHFHDSSSSQKEKKKNFYSANTQNDVYTTKET